MENKYFKDFDSWNEKKKNCNRSEHKPPLFTERDIWWVSIGVNVGFEEDGKNGNFVRPVLVIRKFNRKLFLGIPMSTKIKDNPYYVPVTLDDREVSVLISQVRTFSSKRILNHIAKLDVGDYEKVMDRVQKMMFS